MLLLAGGSAHRMRFRIFLRLPQTFGSIPVILLASLIRFDLRQISATLLLLMVQDFFSEILKFPVSLIFTVLFRNFVLCPSQGHQAVLCKVIRVSKTMKMLFLVSNNFAFLL